MKVIAKLKEKIKYENEPNEKLVLLAWDKGNELEYSVHTEINGSYLWGHYFGDGLESAIEYYNNYEKEPEEKITLREIVFNEMLKNQYLSQFASMEIIDNSNEKILRHKHLTCKGITFETQEELNNHLIRQLNENFIEESAEKNTQINIGIVSIEGIEIEELTEEEFKKLADFVECYNLDDDGVNLSDEKKIIDIDYEYCRLLEDGSYDITITIGYTEE